MSNIDRIIKLSENWEVLISNHFHMFFHIHENDKVAYFCQSGVCKECEEKVPQKLITMIKIEKI